MPNNQVMTEMFPASARMETFPEETNPAKERHIYNRSNWLPGPWMAEPFDKVHWIDPATDMDCMIIRGGMGAWCGYVAVTEGHPAYDQPYNDVEADVHGGLTYGGRCMEDGKICHEPLPGRPAAVYWLGFDCSHSADLAPGMLSLDKMMAEKDGTHGLWTRHRDYDPQTGRISRGGYFDEVYRTAGYAKFQVELLAQQLKAQGNVNHS